MKSFTRIVLPILLVGAVVFGITFIQIYSPPDESPENPGIASPGGSGKGGQGLPLKFGLVKVSAPREEPNDKGEMVLPRHLLHLKYWNPDVEVGAPGHYDFWCQNRHDKPVTVKVPTTNCQCAGVELAVVPADAFREYAVGSALAGGPLGIAPGPAAALAHAALARRLKFEPLNRGPEAFEQTIPAADPAAGTHFALVRLAWSGKAVGPKNINADLYASLGDNPTPAYQRLDADINVVPAFFLFRRTGPADWNFAAELPVGELREGGVSHQDFYLASTTRSYLLYRLSTEPPDPCVTWAEPAPASPEEVRSLTEFLRGPAVPDTLKGLSPPRSLYRVRVTVRERTTLPGTQEVRQLDLGPLERRLMVSAVDAGTNGLYVRGRVLGDITVVRGAEGGKVDLGNSFPADQDRSRDVILAAERPGLGLELIPGETVPNFLKVRLEELPPLGDRKQWRLWVTVPKRSLYGALPETSAVLLKTTGPNPRRFRVPVRGMTYDSGGPKL